MRNIKGYTLFLSMFLIGSTTYGQTIYKSEQFTVTGTSVRQGMFTAKALSDNELTSNYHNINANFQNSTIAVRFLINGKDCEFEQGISHIVTIPKEKDGKSTVLNFVYGVQNSVPTYRTDYLTAGRKVVFKLDLRKVLNDIKNNRVHITATGEPITNVGSVYVVGQDNTSLKSKNFHNIKALKKLKLEESSVNGIYEATLELSQDHNDMRTDKWEADKKITRYPEFKCELPLANAIYKLSVEEMDKNIEADSTFRTGAQWGGVWTRDVSYSIYLALGGVNTRVSQLSLLRKVTPSKRIIQDTGSGGAWPISTDRVVWSIAAWEIYKNTHDSEWLDFIYEVICNTVEDDMKVAYNAEYGLMMGESSFLDWRTEQSYPIWMENKDIFKSMCLGTNICHYKALSILCEISKIKGVDCKKYEKRATELKKAINTYLWNAETNQYGEYYYGREFYALSPRVETLGASLAVLFDVLDEESAAKMIRSYPVTSYGTSVLYPQMPFVEPYHNNAVWPFVQSYWNLAAAKAKNDQAVSFGIAAMYRQAGLFLSNYENFVAESGDFQGTQINSHRMLWSISGNLSIVYRILFGIHLDSNRITFKPFVPVAFTGVKTLTNYPYGKATLDITVQGVGSKIASFKVDGKKQNDYALPAGIEGRHKVEILMQKEKGYEDGVNLVKNYYQPMAPAVKLNDKRNRLIWNNIPDAVSYIIIENGKEIAQTNKNNFLLAGKSGYRSYQVKAVDTNGVPSFLSNPVTVTSLKSTIIVEAERADDYDMSLEKAYGYSGTGYVEVARNKNCDLIWKVQVVETGEYLIDVHYSNGEGPINTENKCALRSLYVNKTFRGSVVMPQRGINLWSNWGFSNMIKTSLNSGENTLELHFDEWNENMNLKVNRALIDYIRIIKL